MHLHAEDAFELAALLVEVDDVHRLMPVDPVAMAVALDEHTELVPLAGPELLDLQFAHDPWLALGIDDDLSPVWARMRRPRSS